MAPLPILVVDFDGFLDDTLTVKGWFDIGFYNKIQANNAIEFLIDATEFFQVNIHGPRSFMYGGIQTMQAAVIYWTTMRTNQATAHDLMNLLRFPKELPANWAVQVNSSDVAINGRISQDARDFITTWHNRLVHSNQLQKEKYNVQP